MANWGLYVVSSGSSSIEPGSGYPPAVHPEGHNFGWEAGRVLDSVTLVYIPRGTGIFESHKSGTIEISAGSLFTVFPGVWHRYKPDISTGWDEYWIEFAGDKAIHFIENCRIKADNPVVKISDEMRIASIFSDMVETARCEPHGFEYLLSAAAFSLMALLSAETGLQRNEDIEKSEAIRTARRILMSELDKQIDLKDLAGRISMSYSLFRKTFKEITGLSPHQYRLTIRLHRAERLLRSTNMQISRIAEILGFSSIYYFSELFKKKTGQSPLEYRKEII